jgi:murein tripeptide amidase MpaA
MSVTICTGFEAGSIRILDANDHENVRLGLRTDNAAKFKQWFYFRVVGARGLALGMTIEDVAETNKVIDAADLPDAWAGYRAVASYDLENWFRIPTLYDGKNIKIDFKPERDSVYIANFAPYTLERLRNFIARASLNPLVHVEVLGRTPDGHDFELLTFGETAPNKKKLWAITRQHPSETPGSWCIEGLMERLLDDNDPLTRKILDKSVFYVIPNMNPDGSARGNTRSNAYGVNLNREWELGNPGKAPEVVMMRREMDERGVHFCVDVHAWAGDRNFACGPFRTPSITPQQMELWERYANALAKACPDFELGVPYPGGGPKPGEASSDKSWNFVTEKYGAFGLLYELLTKDKDRKTDDENAWTPQRCKRFGRQTLDAISEIVDDLPSKNPGPL